MAAAVAVAMVAVAVVFAAIVSVARASVPSSATMVPGWGASPRGPTL